MTEPRILEPTILDAMERYFELLQGHASAQEMTQRVLTDDFETGFVGGYMWRGPDGLAAFLADRSVFFDESHKILQLMDITQPAPETISVRTRLRFFLRRHEPPAAVSGEFTGQAFHTWRLRRQPPDSGWRVAAQMVDGFAMLNDNAAAPSAAPPRGCARKAVSRHLVSRHGCPEVAIRAGPVTLRPRSSGARGGGAGPPASSCSA